MQHTTQRNELNWSAAHQVHFAFSSTYVDITQMPIVERRPFAMRDHRTRRATTCDSRCEMGDTMQRQSALGIG